MPIDNLDKYSKINCDLLKIIGKVDVKLPLGGNALKLLIFNVSPYFILISSIFNNNIGLQLRVICVLDTISFTL
jgi:hypothetical protein